MFDLLSMFFTQDPRIHKKMKEEKRLKKKQRKEKHRKAKRRVEKQICKEKRHTRHHNNEKYCDSSSDEDECLDKYVQHSKCLHTPDNSHNKNKIVEKLYDVIQQVDNKITCNTLQSNMEDYFNRDPSSGLLTPKFVQMNVNNTIINVPTYTLVNHTNMNVKDFKCKFKTDAYNLGVHCHKNFDIETEVTFTRDNVNDGYIRINEILLKDNF